MEVPAGLPGSITWKSKVTGIPAYNLAMAASGQSGHDGSQARFYMSHMMHERLRSMAKAAAAGQQAPPMAANL